MKYGQFGTGSVAFDVLELIQWPPNEPVKHNVPATADSPCESILTFQTDGRIEVRIIAPSGEEHVLLTPQLIRPKPAPIRMAYCWDDEEASIAVNGTTVARATGDQCSCLVDEMEIQIDEWTPDAAIQERLNQLAAEAKHDRTNRARSFQVQRGRPGRLRTLDEILASLKSRRLALLEMAQAALDGRQHHLYGVSAALRLLICKGGGNFHPLVQRAAGLLDRQLLVYGHDSTVHAPVAGHLPNNADYSFVSQRSMPRLYQMDLDSWLDQTGYVFEGTPKTNNDLLRLIADSDASHYDPVVDPDFEYWNALVVAGSPYRADILLRTASVTVSLIDQLLKPVED